ncbi:putative ankyrin repeat protein [Lachnellula occidentalis]|uniref:Putative ankyrin repeat protein n=1 Tax=Lachnellula occidentalis TaxID=215460 RepID=A0A8H8RS73_9HELO|nr:putative ankyrin repeat protein [Lachnellula occidentalis]
MDSFKAKLRRGRSALREGFKRDSSSTSTRSSITSAAASTRGSHDERPNQIKANGVLGNAQNGTGNPLQKTPAVVDPEDKSQLPAGSVGVVATSTPSGGVPEVVVSSHSSAVEISRRKESQTIETIPYSTVSLTTEEVGFQQAVSVPPATPPQETQPSIESSKLWQDAYKTLRKDQPELVKNYEIILKHAANIPQKADLRGEVAKVVSFQKEKMENGQWCFQWNDKPQKIRDVIHKILKITDKAASLVDMGMTYAPPYVSIPWAAIGAILPFMLSGFAEEEDAIAGIEKVAKIISSYRIVEDAFLLNPDFAKTYSEAVLPLYVKVLEYQAIAAQHFGHHTLTRFGASMVKATGWSDALAEIDGLDNRSRGSVLHLGIQAQQKGFENMQGNFGELVKMFENRDDVLKAYLKEFFVHKGEVEQLLTDLSTIPYKQDHRDVRKELGSAYFGSGQWLLKHETVSGWRDWKADFNVVWLEGSVGTGKSSLTSMLLEDLAQTPSGNLAFFYCSKKAAQKDLQFSARDSVENILRTLIIQLSMSSDGSSISDEIREYHTRSKQGIRGGGMELVDCITLLEGIVAKEDRPRITIIIDALDECVNFNKLLEILRQVCFSTDSVRIFFSSRFDVDVHRHFPNAQKIVIEQQNGPDILKYIDTEISERRVGSGLTDEQAVELKSIVMRRHEGMFIWVVLVIDDILDENEEDRAQMEEDIQIRISALEDSDETDIEKMLSTAYDSVYIKAIGKGKQPARRHIVDVALKWTLCSFRPLTLTELTYAIAIKEDGTLMKNIQGGMILEFCSNLLLEGSGGIVRFAHLSVKHYLERKEPPDYSSLESHAQAATSCLFLKNSPQHHEVTTSTLELSYRAHISVGKSFSSYVKTYWARHCREATQAAIEVEGSGRGETGQNRTERLLNGLEKLINPCQPSKVRSRSLSSGPATLRDAIRLDDEQAVDMLIAANVDVNVRDEFGNTILHEAVRWNRLIILERLIDVEADLNAQNFNGDSPLHSAAFWGFEEVLQALLSTGAERTVRNKRGETALHIAVIQKHKEIVRILLVAGVDKNVTDKWGNKPLHYAKLAKDVTKDDSICNLLEPPFDKKASSYKIPPIILPGLCDYCDIVRWIGESPKVTIYKHWPSYDDLKHSANSGCSLCGLLLREFDAVGCQNILKEDPSEISISLHLVSRQTFSDSDNDTLKATMGGTLHVEFELCLDPNMDLGPLKSEISGRLIAPRPSEQSCFDLIKSWLDDCAKNHSQCIMEPSTLPTRIIDVGPPDGSKEPFLYLSKPGEVGNYLYLSAKRGGNLDAGCLVMSNMQDLYRAIPLLSLPRTFEDAVLITRRLGIQYLWTDAYCILQDFRDDWVFESTKIGQYLRNSTFSLIAASATGPHHGIFEKRQFYEPLLRLPCHELPNVSTSAQPWTGDLCLRHRTKSALDAMSSSVLQRGWMVQELVLPERNVIFGNEQIYWNCQKLSRAEDTICHQSPILRLNGSPNGTTPIAGEDYTREFTERWYYLVEIYSGTTYVHSKDRLPGLSHMVKHMLQQIQTTYHAGLWRSSFIRGLLWRAKSITPAHRFQEYIAPSWSWASLNGPVSYTLGLNESSGSPDDAEILDIQISTPASNTTGVVDSGFLTLRALSRTISKTNIPKGCNYYFDDAGFEEEWRGGREFVHVFVCKWAVDRRPGGGTKSAGLVLRRVEGETETEAAGASFQRVGLVTGPDDDVAVWGKEWERREFRVI